MLPSLIRRIGLALAGLGAAAPLGAQQYITDDAGLTEHRACQIQMWVGQRPSWVLPVCTPVQNLEFSAGFIAVWEDGAEGHFEYVVQAKTLLWPPATNGWGVGLVVGIGRDPALASTADKIAAYYLYVPLSLSLASDRLGISVGATRGAAPCCTAFSTSVCSAKVGTRASSRCGAMSSRTTSRSPKRIRSRAR